MFKTCLLQSLHFFVAKGYLEHRERPVISFCGKLKSIRMLSACHLIQCVICDRARSIAVVISSVITRTCAKLRGSAAQDQHLAQQIEEVVSCQGATYGSPRLVEGTTGAGCALVG
jgi:hypothetical protein